MKVELGIKWGWLIFLLICGIHLTAQETFNFDNGSFELLIKANYAGSSGISQVPSNSRGVSLDYSGVEKPQLQFRFQNVKWEGIEGATLFIKSDWVSPSSGIKKFTTRDINLKRSSHKKQLLFEPKANGRQTITIKYGIQKSGEDEPVAQNTIVKEIIIKGLAGPDVAAIKPDIPEKIVKPDPEKIQDTKTPTTANGTSPNSGNKVSTSWPTGLSGNTYTFGEGKLQVRISGNNQYLPLTNSSSIDYANNTNNPQVSIDLSNLEWKDPTNRRPVVIKPNWLAVNNDVLSPIGLSSDIVLNPNQSKRIILKVNRNGQANIRLQFGYISETGEVIGPFGPGGQNAITKTLMITGLGAPVASDAPVNPNLAIDPKLAAAEEAAWKTAKETNTFVSYLAYWNQYRDTGKYSKECGYLISKINIDYEFIEQKENEEGKEYLINLNNVQRFTIDTTGEGEGLITEVIDANNIRAVIKDGKKHTLKVVAQFRRTLEIELDPKSIVLKALFEEAENGKIKFEITGGKKPYYLSIVDAKTRAKVCDLGRADMKTNELAKDYIYANCLVKLDGNYKIAVKDRRKSERVVSEKIFALKSSEKKGILSYLWVVLLVLLIPIGIIIKKNL